MTTREQAQSPEKGIKVRHDTAGTNSPNHIGTIIDFFIANEGVFYKVKFRDFTQNYSLTYVLNNLIK